MIKTPLSTVIGGAFWTPGCTVIGGNTSTFGQQILKLFANGEQGFAYDPNDLTTLYQDAAGTIPVTVAGQPVGLVLDKSKGLVIGNNLSTDPNFTTPSSWNTAGTLGASVSGGKLLFNNVAAYNNAVSNALSSPLVSGRLYKITYQISDYVSGLVRVQLTGGTGANAAALSGNGTFTSYVFAIGNHTFIGFQATIAGTTLKISSLKVEEIAGNHAFQTVSASRPILQRNATTGAYYLAFDGVDDFLQTNSIDFTATDKVSLFAGVRKLSEATTAMLVELSIGGFSAGQAGNFYISAPYAANSRNYALYSRGSSLHSSAALGPANYLSPISNVISAKASIGDDSQVLRIDGKQVAQSLVDQGTGNYGNYPLYIGRRGGTSLPFNGHLYSLIGIGRLTTDSETITLEKAIAKNVGVTLNV